MAINYTLAVSDPDGLLGSNRPALIQNVDFVMTLLGQYLSSVGTLDLIVDVSTQRGHGRTRPDIPNAEP